MKVCMCRLDSDCPEHGDAALLAATPSAEPAGVGEPPFVVRQFEGTPWVPLHEAARLHDAVQEANLTIAGLRNSLVMIPIDANRLARAMWSADQRPDRGYPTVDQEAAWIAAEYALLPTQASDSKEKTT